MSDEAKARANREFVAKLKTLTFGCGAKPKPNPPPKCPDCGGAMVKVTGVAVVHVHQKREHFGRN